MKKLHLDSQVDTKKSPATQECSFGSPFLFLVFSILTLTFLKMTMDHDQEVPLERGVLNPQSSEFHEKIQYLLIDMDDLTNLSRTDEFQ
jgi:hypothetical protein